MSLRGFILSSYQEAVALNQTIPPELKQALKTNERVPRFLNKMELEIAVLPERFRTPVHIKTTVYSLTEMFLKLVKQKADEAAMSQLAKSAMIKKVEEAANVSRFTSELLATGEYSEEMIEDANKEKS